MSYLRDVSVCQGVVLGEREKVMSPAKEECSSLSLNWSEGRSGYERRDGFGKGKDYSSKAQG